MRSQTISARDFDVPSECHRHVRIDLEIQRLYKIEGFVDSQAINSFPSLGDDQDVLNLERKYGGYDRAFPAHRRKHCVRRRRAFVAQQPLRGDRCIDHCRHYRSCPS